MPEQILAASRKMLELAKEDGWEQVEQLWQERQKMFEQLFPVDEATVDAAHIKVAIEEVLQLDGQIRALAEARHKAIGQTLGQLNQGRQATRAYRENARR